MQLIKLNLLTLNLSRTKLIQRFISSHNERKFEKKSIENSNSSDKKEDNLPIQYTTSPAAQWKAEYSLRGTKEKDPWYQPYIVGCSTIIFLLYFTVYRESNDIDAIFEQELGDHFPDVNMQALEAKIGLPPNKSPKTFFK